MIGGYDMIETILHGVLLAIGLILPLGVQNVFVFNQGASQPNFIRAIPVIVTASVCDTLLILLAVTGVSIVVMTFAWLEMLLFGFGFFFLLYMGYVIWRSDSGKIEQGKGLSIKKQVTYAASVSILNPHAILDTIGVIGTNSLTYVGTGKWVFTFSAIVVSWFWFFGLAVAGRIIGNLDQSGNLMKSINKVSAIIIWGVALYMGYKILIH